MTEIYDVLRSLGITGRFLGCLRAALAIQIAINNPDALYAVTKEIYFAVARAEECSWQAVERNLRTAILRAWDKNRPLLCKIAGYPLTAPPTISEFIEMVAYYTQKHELSVVSR